MELIAMAQTKCSDFWIVSAHQTVEYKISIVNDIFALNSRDLLEFGSKGLGARRLIVIDQKLIEYYLQDIKQYFDHNRVQIHVLAVQCEEKDKNLDLLIKIIDEMERFGLVRRAEPVIAIGGGVLLDVVGMAAGLYRRGVPYIRVPTTLIGQIDASVGIKTGINYSARRNRLGSYYPPLSSYIDTTFLDTLPLIDISSGLGEMFKMAVIKDENLFKVLTDHGRQLYASKFQGGAQADVAIRLAVVGMKQELEKNLWERDLKRIVDFGHTFSPLIEMRSIDDTDCPSLTHGHAVALDVIFSSVISFNRGLITRDELDQILNLALALSLPMSHELFRQPRMIYEALTDTIKHRDGSQNLPVPNAIGTGIFLNDVTYDEIKKAVLTHSRVLDEISFNSKC